MAHMVKGRQYNKARLSTPVHAMPQSVADAGFLEGGFRYGIAREARAKFLKPRPAFD